MSLKFNGAVDRVFLEIARIIRIGRIPLNPHMRLLAIRKKCRIESSAIAIADISPDNGNILTFRKQCFIEAVHIAAPVIIQPLITEQISADGILRKYDHIRLFLSGLLNHLFHIGNVFLTFSLFDMHGHNGNLHDIPPHLQHEYHTMNRTRIEEFPFKVAASPI